MLQCSQNTETGLQQNPKIRIEPKGQIQNRVVTPTTPSQKKDNHN